MDSPWPFGDIPPLSYDVILADPPWPFDLWSGEGNRKSPSHHYSVMSFAQIAELPVGKLGRGDAILFMWCCWPTVDQAIDVLKAWGFRYVTGGAWHKRTKNGLSAFGTGYRMRSACEPFLIGTLGNPKTVRNIRNVIDAQAREHSRKPDEQYEICERIMPHAVRRIELFARQSRPGWDAFGNERTKFDEFPGPRRDRKRDDGACDTPTCGGKAGASPAHNRAVESSSVSPLFDGATLWTSP